MSDFKPDARQKALIEPASKSHRAAQAKRKYAPRRLAERWSSETETDCHQDHGMREDGMELRTGWRGVTASPNSDGLA